MTNQYTQFILKSYADTGIINPKKGVHYPPKKLLSNILDLIRELLFPGFFGSHALDDNQLEAVTEQRVTELVDYLTPEIEKCLVWNPENSDAKLTKENARVRSSQIVDKFLHYIPSLRKELRDDAKAIFSGDPAAKSLVEVIVSYPGFQAVIVYRIAHFFYKETVPLIPRMLTEMAHLETGIDIHPGAKIGQSFCIDHGSGIVIGETAIIGNHVKLYQGVTLGAFSVKKEKPHVKRHPTLGDHVTVYSMSTILGGETVVGEHSIIGGNVWLTRSILPYSKIYLSEDFETTYRLIQGNPPS